MSRQNKVNPGTYTQRGRLSQDDAARELRKQSAIGSPHTWQPFNAKTGPRLAAAGDATRDTDTSPDNEPIVETAPVEKRRASRATRRTTAPKAARSSAKTKATKAKTARTQKSERTTGKAKTGKALKTTMKRTATKRTRKNPGGRRGDGGAGPRRTAKRRKS